MKLRRIIFTTIAFSLLLPLEAVSQSQGYVSTPVTVSKNKVKEDGRTYYSHIVLEKQTLYSISKAYGVSVEAIYEANKNLREEGLKKNQILLIPADTEETALPASDNLNTQQNVQTVQAQAEPEFRIHIVKWYEDLNSIARKYGISVDMIKAFNKLTSNSVSRRQELRIPLHPESIDLLAAEAGALEEHPEDSDSPEIAEDEPETIHSIERDVKVSLVLPFNAWQNPSESQFDFYAGVLLAIKDLSDEGIDTRLDVFDCTDGSVMQGIRGSDLVIGPISPSDITSALDYCPEDAFIISPLDPKGAALAETHPQIVQAPSSSESQSLDIAEWISSEMRPSDKVIVFSEKAAGIPASTKLILDELERMGISAISIPYGILEGRDIISSVRAKLSANGTNRIIIASESQAFVNDVVRNVNILLLEKFDMILYSTSKIRSFDTIEVAHFHDTQMRVSISYYIDYDALSVRRFLKQYRALYNTEPSQFAYQGYDTAYHFIKARAIYGKNWPEKLSEISALQSNIRLEKTANGGYVNKAVRRIVYGKGYTISTAEK